ncbi:MAG: hypothetical protein U9O24_02035 [Campylobacterota bacterium]|nr:hypothetical protein [Campylobacterota bacterium]
MKNNLGKLLFTLLYGLWLQAEDFTHHFTLSNSSPYIKEGVVLTLDLNQTNHDKVLFFQFTLKKSPTYTFHRLSAKERGANNAAKIHYAYLIYPLQQGELALHFELTQKATTEENLAYSFSGDRDNVKGLTTLDTSIKLAPLLLQVKPLPDGTSVVGDFNLTYHIKKHQANAYEALPFQVILKGLGYPPLLENILPKEGNFTRFEETPIVKVVNSLKGTKSSVTYPMALSHHESFDLNPLVIKAFNPKTKQSYTLNIKKQHFNIQPVEPKSLVDKIDYPKTLQSDFSWLTESIGYIVVFVAGYFTALSLRWRPKEKYKQTKKHPLKEKINRCRDEKALLQLLMATDAKYFSADIEKLEKHLYGKSKVNIKQFKQDLGEKVQ